MSDPSDYLIQLDAVLVDQLVESLALQGNWGDDPEKIRALRALREVRNRIVHHRPSDTSALTEEARVVVDDVLRFLTQIERSSLGAAGVRAVRRTATPEDLSEIMSRMTAPSGEDTTSSRFASDRELQRKLDQQARAQEKADEARRSEEANRSTAAKARAAAAKTRNPLTARRRTAEAERCEEVAARAARSASYWAARTAGYKRRVTALHERRTSDSVEKSAATRPSGTSKGLPAEFGAPLVDSEIAVKTLEKARFPVNAHNLFAVQERLGILFTVKARQFIEGVGKPGDWDEFLRLAGYPPADDMYMWPQRVLNALARWDPDAAPYIQDFPERYANMLLEQAGSDRGFFSDPASPLPVMGIKRWAGIYLRGSIK